MTSKCGAFQQHHVGRDLLVICCSREAGHNGEHVDEYGREFYKPLDPAADELEEVAKILETFGSEAPLIPLTSRVAVAQWLRERARERRGR